MNTVHSLWGMIPQQPFSYLISYLSESLGPATGVCWQSTNTNPGLARETLIYIYDPHKT